MQELAWPQRRAVTALWRPDKETAIIRKAVGTGLSIVTPGVRQKEKRVDDHARATPPGEAIRAGSDYLVIGRPIRDAKDPVAAIEEILAEMQTAFDARTQSVALVSGGANT